MSSGVTVAQATLSLVRVRKEEYFTVTPLHERLNGISLKATASAPDSATWLTETKREREDQKLRIEFEAGLRSGDGRTIITEEEDLPTDRNLLAEQVKTNIFSRLANQNWLSPGDQNPALRKKLEEAFKHFSLNDRDVFSREIARETLEWKKWRELEAEG